MSEAERINDPGLPESANPVPSVPPYMMSEASGFSSPHDSNDEDWETVDFPGAMSIDAIPKARESSAQASPDPDSEELAALSALGQTSLEGGEVGAEMMAAHLQQLQQENGELRDRLAQLEQDLVQQQIELQLEVARSLHNVAPEDPQPEVSESHRTQELVLAKERIDELLQELEISKQMAQRQRILAETLTEQLESSQERVAQLERDCALAQQRYNEQVQQLLQAENTCRDLRMRLHRQQRQTLQFKAALEKCLEMTPAQRQSQFISGLTQESHVSAPVVTIPPTSLAQVLAPKNQPVRPWSAPSEAESASDLANSTTLPKPLSRLLHPVAPDDAIADRQNEPSASKDWVSEIFQNAPVTQPEPAVGAPSSNPIFDLTPFLEAQTSESALSSPQTVEEPLSSDSRSVQPEDSQLLQMLASVPLDSDELGNPLEAFPWGTSSDAEDGIWDDLARLIESSPKAETREASGPSPSGDSRADTREESSTPSASPGVPVADINPATAGSGSQKDSQKPLELISWADRSGKSRSHRRIVVAIPDSAEAGDLQAASSGAPSETITETVNSSSDREMVAGGWPSPVVYPLRPSRKLKSLAAVDLPSFPKAR
ncbi:hypothetical protein J5X98_13815 [Leptothermofonsia sichuanensis E412]|uniref:hypothetical protein n=1 Tax=Leptothermofonsia sichuanensis TaxID=2917832 RepID=UPI001CA73F21|nr:hypothetical protein [Leptothermofonsia sichuanensis]QZZ18572.1 hypothetical protein J5X98_13815 [Leptothermofonsia sichuanensis E412]